MIITNKEKEKVEYEKILHQLEEVYGPKWNLDDLSAPDKILFKGQRKLYEDAVELYDDFVKHNW